MRWMILPLVLALAACGDGTGPAAIPAVGAYSYHIEMPNGYAAREYSGTLHITRATADDLDAYWDVDGFERELVGSGSRVGVGDTYYLMAKSSSGGIATLVGGSGERLTCTAGALTTGGLDYALSCSLVYRG